MVPKNKNLFSIVKYYRKFSQELQAYLAKNPYDFPRYQEKFNTTVEKISVDLLDFEKKNMDKSESKIYKFRRIFEKRYRSYFLFGDLTKWTYTKPYGYAGDFKIIDNIYQNNPKTIGFDGLWDHYYLQMTACRATRGRKDDLKKIILDFVSNNKNKNIRMMDLASGPAREIKELLDSDHGNLFSRVIFDCYDFDIRSIDYAKKLVNNSPHVNFYLKNAVRMALTKDISKDIPQHYDFIYSAGLFDYLDIRVAGRLANNLYSLLNKGGIMLIANFGDKFNNSSAGLMEWVTEWNLIYRTEGEFRKIFTEYGFSPITFKIKPAQNNVLLYCFINKL
jgi:hypothetical protein